MHHYTNFTAVMKRGRWFGSKVCFNVCLCVCVCEIMCECMNRHHYGRLLMENHCVAVIDYFAEVLAC